MPTTVNSFGELFTTQYLILYFSLCALNTVLLFFSSSKFLLAFQQTGYKTRKYLKWFKSKNNSYFMRLLLLCMLAFMFFNVLCMTFAPIVGEVSASFVGFISYVLFAIIYVNTEYHVNAKVKLRATKRLVRLCITYGILIFAMSFGVLVLADLIVYGIKDQVAEILRYSLMCVTPLLAPLLLAFAGFLNKPMEAFIIKRYIRKTTWQLDNANIIKIGVTGSYGKTTVKKILDTILSQKYRVLATPESYNTPLGISLTVKKLDSTHDVFIAEMGARHKGDIADLAGIVKPRYAVLTGVNAQHLETFGTEENIKNAKFELFESLGENGYGFFSADNEGSIELYEKWSGEKYSAGVNGEFVKATKITVNENGLTFSLQIKGEKPVTCHTTLLGKHNISNICLASAVAYKIGLTPTEIAEGINRLKSVGHRLELVTNNKDITIIDDSYNANEDGVRAALEVLDCFSGRKIVLTPGMIELGKRENLANYEFGKLLAGKADKVIIIGKHNAEMLIKGLLEAGMQKENILFAKSLQKGNILLNEILQKGDVVLFENDLPDTYN